MAGHHIGVALDDDPALLLGDLLARKVDAVEHLALLVERGLGRVQVLGALVIVEELAGAEPDDITAEIANRPDEPAPEPVVDAPVALAHEPPGHELCIGEALAAQVLRQGVPRLRGEPDPELPHDICVESALREELAADLGLGRPQLLRVVRGRQLVGLDEPRPLALLLVYGSAAVDIAQLDPGLDRELLDRLGEGEVVDLLDEAEDVAALAAAEAVPHAPAGRHVEARAALVMERAQSLERPAARRLQGDVLAHDLVDAGPLAHGRDVVVTDPAGHARECTCAWMGP